MRIQLIAVYDCGHASREMLDFRAGSYRKLHQAIAKAVQPVVARDGSMTFECKICKRGASLLRFIVDGKVVEEHPATEILKGRPGVGISEAPLPENN